MEVERRNVHPFSYLFCFCFYSSLEAQEYLTNLHTTKLSPRVCCCVFALCASGDLFQRKIMRMLNQLGPGATPSVMEFKRIILWGVGISLSLRNLIFFVLVRIMITSKATLIEEVTVKHTLRTNYLKQNPSIRGWVYKFTTDSWVLTIPLL